jgi:hypothetical protein
MGFNLGKFLGDAGKFVGRVAKGHVADAARLVLPPNAQQGFDHALKAMASPQGAAALGAIRGALPADAQKGFDVGVGLVVGQHASPPPPGMTPDQEAAYSVAMGMGGPHKAEMLGLMDRGGLAMAVNVSRHNWWHRLLHALGLEKW